MKFFILSSFLSLLVLPALAQETHEAEELSGFTAIEGAYAVTATNSIDNYDAQGEQAEYDALLPLLQSEKPDRKMLADKPFAAEISLLNRRSDRKEVVELSSLHPQHFLEDEGLIITLHQCVENANGKTGNAVAFIEVQQQTDEPQAENDSEANAENTEENRMLFSGWVYKNFPSANQFEHPVYSLKLLDCTSISAE